MEVQLNDKTIITETLEDMVVKLREAKLSCGKIEKLLKPGGPSRAWIHKLAQRNGLGGNIQYPELKDPFIFEDSDEIVADNLNVSKNRVITARKKLGIHRGNRYTVQKRREFLCQYLFGKEYYPCNIFVDFLLEKAESLTPRRKELILLFYGSGTEEIIKDDINFNTQRSYRDAARKDLKELITESNSELEERLVICKRLPSE